MSGLNKQERTPKIYEDDELKAFLNGDDVRCKNHLQNSCMLTIRQLQYPPDPWDIY